MPNPTEIGGAVRRKNSDQDTRILAQYTALEQAIRDRNLTECLNQIERLGFHQDFAIFMLALAQFGGEA